MLALFGFDRWVVIVISFWGIRLFIQRDSVLYSLSGLTKLTGLVVIIIHDLMIVTIFSSLLLFLFCLHIHRV